MTDEDEIRAMLEQADQWLMAAQPWADAGREPVLRYQALYFLRALLPRHADLPEVHARVESFFAPNSRIETFVQKTKNAMREPYYHRVSSPHLRSRTDVEHNADRSYAFLLLWILSRYAVTSPRHQADCLEMCEKLAEMILKDYTLTDYFNGNWIEGLDDKHFHPLWGTNDAAFSSRMTFRALEGLCAYRHTLLRLNRKAQADALGAEILARWKALAYIRIKAKGCVTYEVQDQKPLNTAYYLASFMLVKEQFPKTPWPEFAELDVDSTKFESMLVDDVTLLLRQTFEGEFTGSPFLPEWEAIGKVSASYTTYVESAAVIGIVCMSAISLLRGRLETHVPPDLKGSALVNCARRTEQALAAVMLCQSREAGGFTWNLDNKNQAPTAYFTSWGTSLIERYLRYSGAEKPTIPLDSQDDPLSLAGSVSILLTPEESQRLVRSIMGRGRESMIQAVLQGIPTNRMAFRKIMTMIMCCEDVGNSISEEDLIRLLADDSLFRGTWDEFMANVSARRMPKIEMKP